MYPLNMEIMSYASFHSSHMDSLFNLLSPLSAKIISAAHLEEVQEHFEKLDPQALVIWDVDETLIIPADRILKPGNGQIRRELTLRYIGEKPREKWQELISQVLSRTPYCLVDPQSPKLISSLKKKGIAVMAFTAMRTGTYGIIPSMENWRIHQLRQLGIDFSDFLPQHSGLNWQETKPRLGSPAFREGILCSDQLYKGPIFDNFLKKIDWKPSQVLFLDDNFHCLISVEQALGALNIPFIGIHYLGAELLHCPVDLDVAHHQYQVLAEKGLWLTDQEAVSSLQKTPTRPSINPEKPLGFLQIANNRGSSIMY